MKECQSEYFKRALQRHNRILEIEEDKQRKLYTGQFPPKIEDKIEQVGTHTYEWGNVPVYKEKDTGTMSNTDTMALLTRMVNELKAENEMLKSQLFTKKYEGSVSSLGKHIGDIEDGKVVER